MLLFQSHANNLLSWFKELPSKQQHQVWIELQFIHSHPAHILVQDIELFSEGKGEIEISTISIEMAPTLQIPSILVSRWIYL